MFFTYKITFTNTGEYYIGGKYNKRAHPSELGTSYFSSSPTVQQKLFKHGSDNVVFDIVGEHDTKESCRAEEYSLINKHKDDPLCINKQGSKEVSKKLSEHHKNGTYDKRNKCASNRMKLLWQNEEFREKMSSSTKGRSWKLSEDKAKKRRDQLKRLHEDGHVTYDNVSGTVWINNGHEQKRVKPDNIPDGFVRGRL